MTDAADMLIAFVCALPLDAPQRQIPASRPAIFCISGSLAEAQTVRRREYGHVHDFAKNFHTSWRQRDGRGDGSDPAFARRQRP